MRIPLVHPLAGSRPSAVLRTLIRQGGVAPAHWHRLAIILASCVLRSPSCLLDDIRVRMRAPRLDRADGPVFIVGHWRSGTTLLHNLMASDPRFIFPTLLEVVSPYDYYPTPVSKLVREPILRLFPATRPMDAVPFNPSFPQEEEAALASMATLSFFNCLYFPKDLKSKFDREVLFEGLSDGEIAPWKKAYRFYLAKLYATRNEGILLVKNPSNSARIPHLLELFPDSKFIHITRNPNAVLPSTRRLYADMLKLVHLQPYDERDIEAAVVRNYPKLMAKLLKDWPLISNRNRVVVRYEDLIEKPTDVLEQIYGALGLPGFADQKPRAEQFLQEYPIVRAAMSDTPPDRASAEDTSLQPYFTALGYETGQTEVPSP